MLHAAHPCPEGTEGEAFASSVLATPAPLVEPITNPAPVTTDPGELPPPSLTALPDSIDDATVRRPGVVGYIPGAWDMFHVGHLNALRFARERCDHLVVGVTSDEELERVKGRRPIVPLAERLEVIGAIGIVDEAVEDTSTNKLLAWSQLHFDVLFKGDDWQGTVKGDHLEMEMQAVGVALQYFPYTRGTSSTLRRKDLLSYE